MDFPQLHPWPQTAREAIALQRELAGRVRLGSPSNLQPTRVAGVDVSHELYGHRLFAAVVVLSWPDLQQLTSASAEGDAAFPYIPGLLSFRELPVLLEAFRRLPLRPDLVLVDGQGIAHPRRLGLASHLGLWLDLPTIGCAKSRLCGVHDPPGQSKGDQVPLLVDGEEIGALLTTRNKIKPLYISPGHRIDLASAIPLVLSCTSRYRLPEPTRLAHQLTNRLRRQGRSNS